MKSKIAEKIHSNVSQETKDIVKEYSDAIVTDQLSFKKWLEKNRWFTFENGLWHYTFEHPTVMSDEEYETNYKKTTEALYELYRLDCGSEKAKMLMDNIHYLCVRYHELYVSERNVRNCTDDEVLVILTEGYLADKSLFDEQWNSIKSIVTRLYSLTDLI